MQFYRYCHKQLIKVQVTINVELIGKAEWNIEYK